jgi:hypothetical protein
MEKIMENNLKKPNGKALIPFLVFIIVYLGSGTYLSLKGVSMAFYQFPAPVAVFIGVVTAFILVSMLTGGLAHMVTKEGGLEFLIQKIKSKITGRKSAELGITAIVTVTDMAIANNTVSIIIDGPIAKENAEEYHVDPRRSASLLDTFACVTQGMGQKGRTSKLKMYLCSKNTVYLIDRVFLSEIHYAFGQLSDALSEQIKLSLYPYQQICGYGYWEANICYLVIKIFHRLLLFNFFLILLALVK